MSGSEIRLVAVGDLSFNGLYHQMLARRGLRRPFRHVARLWADADLRLGNLESPETDAARVAPTKLTLRGAPGACDALALAGFDLVSLANNHAMDFGPAGLEQTRDHLRRAGVAAVGAGPDEGAAAAPVILHRRGQTVGVLAFCDVNQSSPLYAGPDRPGVARLEPEAACQRVADLRRQVDRVVVQVHWGEELAQLPDPGQRETARRLVDAGADLILGHHPHVLQPLEFVAGVPVFYSLGNFLFSDMFWAGKTRSGQGFVARYRRHPLSAQTGWADVLFRPGARAIARLVPARLGSDLAVRPDDGHGRAQGWQRLGEDLVAGDYQARADAERERARERRRWQEDHLAWHRRVEVRLFGAASWVPASWVNTVWPAAVLGD